MYSKYGKTKMFTWFFAFLTMFIIAFVLVMQVGLTVDADGSNTYFNCNFYDTINGHLNNEECLNTTFYSTANVGSLSLGDLIPTNGSVMKSLFDNNFTIPETFVFNDAGVETTLNFLDTYDSFFIIPSGISGQYNVVFYNSQVGENTVIINNYLYRKLSQSRDTIFALPASEKAKYTLAGFTTSFDNENGTNNVLSVNGAWLDTDSIYHQLVHGYTVQSIMIFNNAPSSGGRVLMCSNELYQAVSPSGNFSFNPWLYFGIVTSTEAEQEGYDVTVSDNYNYLLNGSNSGDDGDSSNNLYCENAHWSFSIPKKWSSNISSNGKAVFSAVPNSYQQNHSDEFEFHYIFNIQVVYKDSSGGTSGGGGHDFGDNNNNTRGASNSNNDLLSNKTFTYYNSHDDVSYYIQDMDSFINAGGQCTFWTYDYLFENCLNGNEDFKTFITSTGTISSMEHVYLSCTAYLLDNSGGVSGSCSSWYDFVTSKSGTTSDLMNINQNPTDNSNYTPDYINNSGGSGGYIINNDNDTLTINSDKSTINTLIDKLIPTDLTDENGGLTQSITDTANTNGYLALLRSCFGTVIPAAFWTKISALAMVYLNILAVAFVIWLIAHFF